MDGCGSTQTDLWQRSAFGMAVTDGLLIIAAALHQAKSLSGLLNDSRAWQASPGLALASAFFKIRMTLLLVELHLLCAEFLHPKSTRLKSTLAQQSRAALIGNGIYA